MTTCNIVVALFYYGEVSHRVWKACKRITLINVKKRRFAVKNKKIKKRVCRFLNRVKHLPYKKTYYLLYSENKENSIVQRE